MDKVDVNLLKFLGKVGERNPEECWPWLGSFDRAGYGIYGHGEHRYAHRVAWKVFIGPIPTELDHTCRNRGCVNPHHLEPVTHAENIRRGALARTGGRCRCGAAREIRSQCRRCFNAYHAAYRARRKAEGRPLS